VLPGMDNIFFLSERKSCNCFSGFYHPAIRNMGQTEAPTHFIYTKGSVEGAQQKGFMTVKITPRSE